MRALIFDFNGTLSHDEPLLCELFCGLFAEAGRPLAEHEYYDRLAGRSDPEIVRTWLGRDDPELLEALEEPTRTFAIGVLWHPEEGNDRRLFEELITEARKYRERR